MNQETINQYKKRGYYSIDEIKCERCGGRFIYISGDFPNGPDDYDSEVIEEGCLNCGWNGHPYHVDTETEYGYQTLKRQKKGSRIL